MNYLTKNLIENRVITENVKKMKGMEEFKTKDGLLKNKID